MWEWMMRVESSKGEKVNDFGDSCVRLNKDRSSVKSKFLTCCGVSWTPENLDNFSRHMKIELFYFICVLAYFCSAYVIVVLSRSMILIIIWRSTDFDTLRVSFESPSRNGEILEDFMFKISKYLIFNISIYFYLGRPVTS